MRHDRSADPAKGGRNVVSANRATLDEGKYRPYLKVMNGPRRDSLELHSLAEGSECRVKVLLSVGGVGLMPPHMDPGQPHLEAPIIFVAKFQGTPD